MAPGTKVPPLGGSACTRRSSLGRGSRSGAPVFTGSKECSSTQKASPPTSTSSPALGPSAGRQVARIPVSGQRRGRKVRSPAGGGRGSSRCLTSTSFHSPRPKAGKWEIPEPEAGGCRPGMVTPHAAWPCAQRTRLPPAALAPHSCPHRHEAPAQALPCTGPRGRPPPQLTPPGDRPPGDSHSPGRPPTSLHTAPGLPPPSLLSPAARPRPRHRLSRKPGDGAPLKAKDETWTFSAPTEAGL